MACSRRTLTGFLVLFGLASFSQAQTSNINSQLTADSDGKEIFQREWVFEPQAAPPQGELTDKQQVAKLMRLPGDGLGPMFNATSCEACHEKGGASGIDHNVTMLTLDPRSDMSGQGDPKKARESLDHLFPSLLSPSGALSFDVVVHEKSARPFYHQIRQGLSNHVPGGIPDQWYSSKDRTVEAVAERPVIAGRSGDLDFYLSQRNSPALFGLGLVDQISRGMLMKIAKSQAIRTKGEITGQLGVGKFGWRAQTPSLDGFVRGACAGELGLQLQGTVQPQDVADETYVSYGTDLNESQVRALTQFVRSLPVPVESLSDTSGPDPRKGKRHFKSIGCNICHVEIVRPARGVYSDFLLHDMGELLQAPSPAPLTRLTTQVTLPKFSADESSLQREIFGRRATVGYYGSRRPPAPYPMARPIEPRFPRGKLPSKVVNTTVPGEITWDQLQREWRTPPLWGVADSAPYMHDGRAETLDAAIRWHGGEAALVTSKYRSLPKESRQELVAFLKSLRSPAQREIPTEMFVADESASQEKLREMAAQVSLFD